METVCVAVGFTNRRPVVPDEFTSLLTVSARNGQEAELIAAQMVAGHCEMVTSTRIVWAEL